MKGTTNVSLNMKDVLKIIISVPSIDTQLSIVKKVEEIKHLEEKIEEAKILMEDFKKSYFSSIFGSI